MLETLLIIFVTSGGSLQTPRHSKSNITSTCIWMQQQHKEGGKRKIESSREIQKPLYYLDGELDSYRLYVTSCFAKFIICFNIIIKKRYLLIFVNCYL